MTGAYKVTKPKGSLTRGTLPFLSQLLLYLGIIQFSGAPDKYGMKQNDGSNRCNKHISPRLN